MIACGSGVGVAIVANKVPGVRAVNAHDAAEAELARRHNDVNVVTLSGRSLTTDQADGDRRGVPAGGLRGRTPRAPGGEDRGDRRSA